MSSKAQIEQTRDSLIQKAQTVRDRKNEEAEAKFKQILAKAKEIYDKQVSNAQTKFDEFISKVEDDTGKRLGIVNKVIAAESEERKFKEKQEEEQAQAEARNAAEQKMRDDAEAVRVKEENKQKRIAAKKAAKAKAKEMELRAKYPIPPGFVDIANSKKLAAKLKRLNAAGRYAFVCFSLGKKDKKFRSNCEALSAEFNTNVAWFNCQIKDNNFEDAMLLYEFNATPAVIVCKEGTPSNLHRYVIGFTDDSQATLKRYAEKADQE